MGNLGVLDGLLSREVSLARRLPAPVISPCLRDGSAHVLRCLKVWYDLPSECFHIAMFNIDAFLARMKAKSKHLPCLTVAAFYLACQQFQDQVEGSCFVPEARDLVSISQSQCTASDLLRMRKIILSKIPSGQNGLPQVPVTAVTYVNAMLDILATEVSGESHSRTRFYHQLEILVSDSSMLKFRSCEMSLSVLQTELRGKIDSSILKGLMEYCKIDGERLKGCLRIVGSILQRYNKAGQVPYRQRLTWRVSNRTLQQLRPLRGMKVNLPNILEEPSVRSSIGGKCDEVTARRRIRSSSECFMELDELSGSDSDTDDPNESIVKVSRTWANVVAGSKRS